MSQEDYYIPTQLDAPPLILFWEADMFAVAVLNFVLCIMIQQYILGIVMFYLTMKGFQKLKDKGGRGTLARTLYWHVPTELFQQGTVKSSVREYIGG